MELTIEEARKYRSEKKVIYVVYNTLSNRLVKVFNWGTEAFNFADSNPYLKYVNISNSIHCPRHIYLMLTPNAQLDFYLDGLLEDDLTRKHKLLRETVMLRERKKKLDALGKI